MQKGQNWRSLTPVLLLLCAILCAQSASLLSEELHRHPSEHCCGLCHTGPLPFVKPTSMAGLAPVLAVLWIAPIVDASAALAEILPSSDTRAPPSLA
jgi:hypothetical protein